MAGVDKGVNKVPVSRVCWRASECAHTRMRQLSRHDANFGLLEVVSIARLPVDLEGFQLSR